MRNFLIAALAATALAGAGAASAQIVAPDTSGQIHPSGSLIWPREDSFAYLRGHGISKGAANTAAQTYATTPTGEPVSARVPEYGYMPSTWQGTWDEWREHQDACSARFKSYNRQNDTYMAKAGARRFCQVGFETE